MEGHFEKIWPAHICFGEENLEAKQLHVHYLEDRNRHNRSIRESILSVIATEKEAAFHTYHRRVVLVADHDGTSHFLNDSVSNLLPWKLSLQSKVDEIKGAARNVPDKTKYRSPIQRVNRD